MRKIEFIEGMRGWLSWTVVGGHLAVMSGVASYDGRLAWLPRAGSMAVELFIVISGFVICNVILERRENWINYITRRGFRIFPAYWVAYALALLIFPIALHLPSELNNSHLDAYQTLHKWAAAMDEHPRRLIAIHLALLQGVIPDNIWPGASEAVLGQAWSLSLEWQFYLVAPLLVFALSVPRWRPWCLLAMITGAVIFKSGWAGRYDDPAILPASLHIFLVGIASRIWMPQLERVRVSPTVCAAALGFGAIFPDMLWLAIWAALFAYYINRESWNKGSQLWARNFVQAAFESPAARYFGSRSYSVYLLHIPLIELSIWIISAIKPQMTHTQLLLALLVIAPISIIAAADILFRLVERPFNKFGGWLVEAKEQRTRPLKAS
jgi:peptidoglycan/LPS O-acetylase OafA/YrhL